MFEMEGRLRTMPDGLGVGTRVIAIANQKGGVGKTTTAICSCGALSRMGRRVLLVDLDQQANATREIGAEGDGASAYELLTGKERDARRCVRHSGYEGVDVLPGDSRLSGAEAEMAGMTCRETILADSLEPIVMAGDYDYVVIDCSPSLGIVTANALVAADEVVVPVMVDGWSLDGLDRLMALVSRVQGSRRLNPGLKVGGLLVCQREPRQRLTAAFDEQLPVVAGQYGTKVYPTSIRRCVKVREAQVAGVALHDYAPGCSTDCDYDQFASELDGEVSR